MCAVVWLTLKESHERWENARLEAAKKRLLDALDDCDPAP
jgi:hypothetical protein